MAEGFLVGAHHGLSIEDVDRACELIIKYAQKSSSTESAPFFAGAAGRSALACS